MMLEHSQAEIARLDLARLARRISAHDVRHLCGGVSDMTLWRWLNDSKLAFPKPIYIARRRYWREAEIVAWLDAQSDFADQQNYGQ